jgi:hypothetical protein
MTLSMTPYCLSGECWWRRWVCLRAVLRRELAPEMEELWTWLEMSLTFQQHVVPTLPVVIIWKTFDMLTTMWLDLYGKSCIGPYCCALSHGHVLINDQYMLVFLLRVCSINETYFALSLTINFFAHVTLALTTKHNGICILPPHLQLKSCCHG